MTSLKDGLSDTLFSSLINLMKRPSLKRLFQKYEDVLRSHKIEDNRCVSCLSYKIDLKHFLRNKLGMTKQSTYFLRT